MDTEQKTQLFDKCLAEMRNCYDIYAAQVVALKANGYRDMMALGEELGRSKELADFENEVSQFEKAYGL